MGDIDFLESSDIGEKIGLSVDWTCLRLDAYQNNSRFILGCLVASLFWNGGLLKSCLQL